MIGLSGSGKSTLLLVVSIVLLNPADGQISFGMARISPVAFFRRKCARIRRKIGMVFQHFNLVHRSKVITNVLAGRLGYINPAWSLQIVFQRRILRKPSGNWNGSVSQRRQTSVPNELQKCGKDNTRGNRTARSCRTLK